MTSFDFSQSLGRLLGMAHHRMKLRLAQHIEANALPLTPEQFRYLAQLWQQDERIQQDLAQCLRRDRANITRITDILARKGLLRRVNDAQDRRVSKIQLTEEGKALESPASSCAAATIADAVKGIDPDELETCMNVLRQIAHNLEAKVETNK